jgi:hypothetical protein
LSFKAIISIILRFNFSNIKIFDVYFLMQSEKKTVSEISIIKRINYGKVILLTRNTATNPELTLLIAQSSCFLCRDSF